MTTITLTVSGCAPRESRLRRLALTAGLALVRWAYDRPARARRSVPLTHEQQALRLATLRAVEQRRDRLQRYGIH